jgi:membrane-associated phospholipid phosphatase
MRADDAAIRQLAAFAGEHALAVFGVSLGVVLLFAWAGWALVHHRAPPGAAGSVHRWPALVLRLGLGFGAIVLGAWVFAELAEGVLARAALGAADEALIAALHASVPQPALQAFAWLTRLANTTTLVVLCVAVALALLWQGRRWLAFGWVAAVGGNGLLNITLKQIFARVRPLHDDGLVLAQGFSFPSGHSSGAVVAYGMLAYVAMRFLPPRWHLAAVLVAAALAFSIGASRVFLRVHFASDVIAGFASGAAWLAVCVTSIELTRWYRGRRA